MERLKKNYKIKDYLISTLAEKTENDRKVMALLMVMALMMMLMMYIVQMTGEKRRHYQTEEMSLVNFCNKRKQEHLLQVLNFHPTFTFLRVQIKV